MRCLARLTEQVQLVVSRHRSDQVCQTCLWRPPAHLGCTHVVCQAAVGQVVGTLAQAKRHGNMPSQWRTSPVEPHPWGHGLRPPMLTQSTMMLEALMSSLFGCSCVPASGLESWEAPNGGKYRRERLRALLTLLAQRWNNERWTLGARLLVPECTS